MIQTGFSGDRDAEAKGARLQPLLSISQIEVPRLNRRRTDRQQMPEGRSTALPTTLQGSWVSLKETLFGGVRWM